ncbi:hypothetical protein EDD17DRAFT_444464 [Pisolithus thermaeus]|nr:hypothetical protein EDD17DRAFT_444464 [Pisolithus thermaeus]
MRHGRVLPMSSRPATLVLCVACPRGAVATVHVVGHMMPCQAGISIRWTAVVSARLCGKSRRSATGGFYADTRSTVTLCKDIPEVTCSGSCHACLAAISIQWTEAAGGLWRITTIHIPYVRLA